MPNWLWWTLLVALVILIGVFIVLRKKQRNA